MLLALKKVPKKGLEPSRLAAHAPETCASTIPPLGPLASAKLALFFELASISPHFFFVFLFGGGWAIEAIEAIETIEAIEAIETIEAIEGIALRGWWRWRRRQGHGHAFHTML